MIIEMGDGGGRIVTRTVAYALYVTNSKKDIKCDGN